MKKGDAVHALSIALKDYSPYPEDAVRLLRDHFGYDGRVFYYGQWQSMDMFLYNVKRIGPASEVFLSFFGGPPNGRKYRKGSLIDMLWDTCLWEIYNGDPQLKVYRFIHQRMMEHTLAHELEYGV